MNLKLIRTFLMACSLLIVLKPIQGRAQQNSGASTTGAAQSPPGPQSFRSARPTIRAV